MGMLDGDIAAIFGEAFGALYLDGSLIRSLSEPVYDGQGNITGYSGGAPVAIKCQVDAATWDMRQADGFTDKDVRIIVLNCGWDVTTDHRIEVSGKSYMLASVDRDAAASHWICRGRAA